MIGLRMGQLSISVVIATRDRSRPLLAALRSVSAQTLRPLEVIVVDDGERPLSIELPDTARVLRREATTGDSGAARNLAIAASRGDLIAFLDDDDQWYPEKLARQVAVLGDAVATSCGFDVVDARGRLHERHLPKAADLRKELLLRPVLQPSSLLVRRDALIVSGGFDERRPRCDDWGLWFRLADLGPIVLQHEVLVTRSLSGVTEEQQLFALGSFYREVIEPRVRPADRPAVLAYHRLVQGVLRARMGQRRAAARLLWRSGARRQLLRLVVGERAWAVLRRPAGPLRR